MSVSDHLSWGPAGWLGRLDGESEPMECVERRFEPHLRVCVIGRDEVAVLPLKVQFVILSSGLPGRLHGLEENVRGR
jgi:hypothetical protein